MAKKWKKLDLSLQSAKVRIQRGRNLLKNVLLDCCSYKFDRKGNVNEIKETCLKNIIKEI